MSQELKLRAGHAAGHNNFCVALHSMDDEDPYSIILVYNDKRELPWNRIDINRNVDDISYLQSEKKFAVLTSVGEVFLIDEKGDVEIEKTGAASGMTKVSVIEETLFVTGLGGQFWKRDSLNKWSAIATPKPESDFEDVDYFDVQGQTLGNVYVVGIANPPADKEAKDGLILQAAEARLNGDKELSDKLHAEFFDSIVDSQGVAFHFDGTEWEEADLYEAEIDTIFTETAQKSFFGTKNSGIFFGNYEDGFDDIDTEKNVRSITKIGNKVVFVAGSALYFFTDKDNPDVKPLKVRAPKGKVPTPLKVQTVDNVMYYFDFNIGVYTWDGDKKWTNIPIPEDLLKR